MQIKAGNYALVGGGAGDKEEEEEDALVLASSQPGDAAWPRDAAAAGDNNAAASASFVEGMHPAQQVEQQVEQQPKVLVCLGGNEPVPAALPNSDGAASTPHASSSLPPGRPHNLPALGRLPWKERAQLCGMVDTYVAAGGGPAGAVLFDDRQGEIDTLQDEVNRLTDLLDEARSGLRSAGNLSIKRSGSLHLGVAPVKTGAMF